MNFEIEYREIKPSRIKPNYSASPKPDKLPDRPYLLPKPKPKDDAYARSWKYD